MKKPLSVYFLPFLFAAIPLVVVQVYRAEESPSPALSRPVPAERIHWVPELKPDQVPATLHVVRESQPRGWAKPITLLIDGKAVASIKDGENVMVRMPPGEHALGLKYVGQDTVEPNQVAAPRSVAYFESVQRLEGSKYHDFRIVPAAGWNWHLERDAR